MGSSVEYLGLLLAATFFSFSICHTQSISHGPFDVIQFLKKPLSNVLINKDRLVLVGLENGNPVYLTRFMTDGSYIVGGFVPGSDGENKFYFVHDGKKTSIAPQELEKHNVEYAHSMIEGGGIMWQYTTRNSLIENIEDALTNAIPIGSLSTGDVVYVCRAIQNDDLLIGRFIGDSCTIHANGREIIKGDFEIMKRDNFGILRKNHSRISRVSTNEKYCTKEQC